MNDCVFCKIVEGEIPSYKVAENEQFLAFLSIDPISPGHTLIIPKEHYRWVWDVPNVGDYFSFARDVAKTLQKAFENEAIHSKIVGEEVPHAHIWIFPEPQTTKGTKKDFEVNLEKIKKAK